MPDERNVNKVVYGGTTLIDLTNDTVTAENLMEGYTAHDASGALIIGEASPDNAYFDGSTTVLAPSACFSGTTTIIDDEIDPSA